MEIESNCICEWYLHVSLKNSKTKSKNWKKLKNRWFGNHCQHFPKSAVASFFSTFVRSKAKFFLLDFENSHFKNTFFKLSLWNIFFQLSKLRAATKQVRDKGRPKNMLVPILNEFQVRNINDEKKCEDNNGGKDNFEINFKNGDPSAEEHQHFQINLKIILPPKGWRNIYQLFSLKFFITFDVPTIIVKRVLSPE